MHKIVTLPPITVVSAGTRVKIDAAAQDVKGVIVQADSANTGKIFVGDITVTSSNGFTLNAREALAIDPASPNNPAEMDISTIYVDSDTSGSIVRITYLF
jgi:hypothetical protein